MCTAHLTDCCVLISFLCRFVQGRCGGGGSCNVAAKKKRRKLLKKTATLENNIFGRWKIKAAKQRYGYISIKTEVFQKMLPKSCSSVAAICLPGTFHLWEEIIIVESSWHSQFSIKFLPIKFTYILCPVPIVSLLLIHRWKESLRKLRRVNFAILSRKLQSVQIQGKIVRK